MRFVKQGSAVVPFGVVLALAAGCGKSTGAGARGGVTSGGATIGSATSSAGGAAGSGIAGTGGSYGGGTGAAPSIPLPGPSYGGQSAVITSGISPKACEPTSSFNGTTIQVTSGDNLTCYYSSSVSETTPLAFIEQDTETIGGKHLVHVRLTMNPAFVDNTYGATAIGWGGTDAGTGKAGMGGGHGHTFWDLVDSDHAEFDFKDSSGHIVLSFNLDYASSDANSPSGFACLGVSGGDGGMLVGSASDVVYYGSSLDRDLNGCGYAQYTTSSPATDAQYTPNPAAPYWDYRVVYDVWVNASALPAGWSVSIPYVHASPSKLASTYSVTPAPCPPLGCVGEGCQTGGNCVGVGCVSCVGERCLDGGGGWGGGEDGGTGGGYVCVGEGCTDAGGCVGTLCQFVPVVPGHGGGGNTLGYACEGEGCTDAGVCVGSLCGYVPIVPNGGGGAGGGNTLGYACEGEGCTDAGVCVGSLCIYVPVVPGFGGGSGCSGEGCSAGGACYGLLCDAGSPTQCVGEGCSGGGSSVGGGGPWCTMALGACTDDSACCSGLCVEGTCR